MVRLLLLAFALPLSRAVPDLPAELAEESLLAGLIADDACQAGGEGAGCSVKLLQLRAKGQAALQLTAAEKLQEQPTADEKHEGVGSKSGKLAFAEAGGNLGPDAPGENLWTGETWELLMAEVNVNSSGCEEDTYGSCSVVGCAHTRGATRCVSGKCLCGPGYCARAGACYPKDGQCRGDTGGSCSVMYCRGWRGQTACEGGRCMCKQGGCAFNGRCVPITDTGGTCGYVGCSSSRGPTTCHRGRCLCQSGFVAVGGRCQEKSW